MKFLKSERFLTIKDTFQTSIKTLKLVWTVDHSLFMGAFFTATIPAVVPFINIYIYKLVIDLVVKTVNGAAFNPSEFYTLIGFRILTYFIQDATFRTQEYIDKLLWTKVPIYLNQLVLGKLSSLDIQYYEDSEFRNLMERAKDGLGFRPQNLISSIMYGFQNLVQFVIAFAAIVHLNWVFVFLVILVTIPEFINQTIQSKFAWGIWGANTPLRKRFDYINRILVGPREAKEVRIFRLAKNFLIELKNIQEKFYKDNKKLAVRGYKTGLVFNGLSTLVFVGIEIYVIVQALAKKVTVGDISFYTGTVFNFQNGLGGFLRNLNNVFDHSLYVKSMFEVLDAKPLIKISKNAKKLNLKKPPLIEFKNISFTYPATENKILNNFSLTIKPGEKIAFVGENGAGKSTIIKLLTRFYDVDSGEILINGNNIKDLDLESWYEHLGVLFQDFNRYEDTVADNIYFGKVSTKKALKKIIESSVSAGSHSFVTKYEKGYEQMLGKVFDKGIEPSGGQWQKLALARAFFRGAPILILDEPTASIDAKAESEIFSRVEKLSIEKTVIIISHRFSTVRNADTIYVIDEGRIVESGKHEDLISLDGQYAHLFKLQAKGYQ